jgi:hypothetical protein
VQDQKIVIIIYVDLGAEVHNAPAVFDIQRMEMVMVLQGLKIFFCRPNNV